MRASCLSKNLTASTRMTPFLEQSIITLSSISAHLPLLPQHDSPNRIKQALLVPPQVLSDLPTPLESLSHLLALLLDLVVRRLGMSEARETARDAENVSQSSVRCEMKVPISSCKGRTQDQLTLRFTTVHNLDLKVASLLLKLRKVVPVASDPHPTLRHHVIFAEPAPNQLRPRSSHQALTPQPRRTLLPAPAPLLRRRHSLVRCLVRALERRLGVREGVAGRGSGWRLEDGWSKGGRARKLFAVGLADARGAVQQLPLASL